MLAVLTLFTGPLAKYAAVIAALVVFLVGSIWLLHEHDNRVRAQVALTQERAISAQNDADHSRIVAALESDRATSDARASKADAIRQAIDNAPNGVACDNPSLDAALRELHNDDGGPIQAGADTGQSARMPLSATDTAP